MLEGQNNFSGYQRFRIPPDFDLVQLHKEASYIYLDSSKAVEMCPCCEKVKREKQIPFGVGTSTLVQLGEQIPMLFYFLTATSVFLFCLAIAKFGDYYLCNYIQGDCPIIYAQFDIPQVGSFQIPSGFKQKNDTVTFIEFIVFVLGIIMLKIAIKIKKYQIKQMTKESISNRALKLINVHKQCSASEIKETFKPMKVQVVLTYKVREFDECLTNINKLLKMKKMKQEKKGSFINQTQKEIDEKMKTEKETLQRIKRQLKMDRNRMSIAFVIFETSKQKKEAYQKFKRNLFSRLFFKACTCCSDTSIRGQSFTVKPADEPADIIWPNLQNPYLRTKIRRFLSIFVCFTLLVFGIATQYLLTELSLENSLVGPLIKSGVVMVLNFLIVTLMDYSTENMQHYESHTQRHLTLVQKMTTFLFINISLPPLVGYYFTLDKQKQTQEIKNTLFYNFCFSVLVLALGNISKPFPLWFSVERVTKTLGKWLGKRSEQKCILTQIQANKQFEPIEFPISTFYSMSLSSFLMVCFYVNILQSIILIEMVSLILMFLVGKYMLLRVCKSPAGLARRISNLAQSLLRIVIFVYWLGKFTLTYLNLNEEEKGQYDSVFGYIFRNAYGYIEFILAIVCLLFLEFFVAWISKIILEKFGESLKSSIQGASHALLLNQDDDEFEMTYDNANMNLKLEEEYTKFSKTQQAIKKKEQQKKKKTFR